jgi:hypothetical protein
VLAVWDKDAMKPGKVLHTRLRHQRRQLGNEIQRFKDELVFCRIPVLEGLDTTIYTIDKVCLAVPTSARRGIITPTLLSISHFYFLYSMAYFPAKR